jgi:hypothetical protein
MAVQQFPMGSTAIDTLWYDAEAESMWIKFRKVKEYPKYHFSGVPATVFAAMLNARSAGAYYAQHIKGNYHSTEITQPGEDGSLNLFQLALGTLD